MKKFCITKENIAKVRKQIQTLGDNAMEKLSEMASKERLDFFRKNLDDYSARQLNKEFEDALLSSKVSKLKNWVKNNLDEKYRDEQLMKSIDSKRQNLDEFNQFIDQNAENFVMQKNNVALTAEEVKKFNKLGDELYKKMQEVGDNIGDLTEHFDENMEFAKKISALQEYVDQLIPSSKWQTFTNTFGKATMLASIKTPFLNIESNTITGIMEAAIRRFSNKRIGGAVKTDVARSYMKNARKIFKETQVDFTRMIEMDDPVTGVGATVGEKLARPKNKAVRAYTDFIFNKTLSIPDVAFSSYAFTDSVNLQASRYANGKSGKATEIFKDATRVEPLTAEGRAVRMRAIEDAMYSTYTNKSWVADKNENIRKLLNSLLPGVGDITMPFVRTPSNVVEAGLDYSGLGVVKGLVKTTKFVRAEGKMSREAMHEVARDLVRGGIGVTAAFAIAHNIKEEDFVGAYDPDRIKIDQLKNTAYNAIKIGDKWVSVDYFGVLGPAITAQLYAKKYGDNLQKRLQSYALGMGSQVAKTPGFEPLAQTMESITKIKPKDNERWFKDFGDRIKRSTMDIVASRSIPGIIYDWARATDEVQRDTRQKKYVIEIPFTRAEVELDKFVKKLPYLRETLPEKYNALGRTMYEEGSFQSLMFGARVKTTVEDDVVDEIYRLRDTGNEPNIKDLRFMYSSKVDKLKEKVGQEKFYEVAREYGQELGERYKREVKSTYYQNLSDEEKDNRLSEISQDLYVKTLKRNGVKYRN